MKHPIWKLYFLLICTFNICICIFEIQVCNSAALTVLTTFSLIQKVVISLIFHFYFRHSAVEIEIKAKEVESTLTNSFSSYKPTTVSDAARKQTEIARTVQEITRTQILPKDNLLHNDVNRMFSEDTKATHNRIKKGNYVSTLGIIYIF